MVECKKDVSTTLKFTTLLEPTRNNIIMTPRKVCCKKTTKNTFNRNEFVQVKNETTSTPKSVVCRVTDKAPNL